MDGSAREAMIVGAVLDKYLPWLLVVSADVTGKPHRACNGCMAAT